MTRPTFTPIRIAFVVCVPDSVRRCVILDCVLCGVVHRHVLPVSQGTSGTLIPLFVEKLADMVSASCVVGALHQHFKKESNHESKHSTRNTSVGTSNTTKLTATQADAYPHPASRHQ
jgi:hypothetical protein